MTQDDVLAGVARRSGILMAGLKRVRTLPPIDTPFRRLIAALMLMVLSCFLYSGSSGALLRRPWCGDRCAQIAAMTINPFARGHGNPVIEYRIFLPALAWVLHLRGPSFLLLTFIAQYLFLVVLLSYLSRVLPPDAVVLCGAAIALSETGSVVLNWPGLPDPVVYLLLALAMRFCYPALHGLILFCGMLADERFVFGYAAVLIIVLGTESRFTTRAWLTSTALGLLLVALVRHGLQVGMVGPGIPDDVYHNRVRFLLTPIRYLIVGDFASFRLLWLVLALLFWTLWTSRLRPPWYVYAHAALLFALAVASSSVSDVTRSMAFGFPSMIGLLIYYHRLNPERFCRFLLGACLANALLPHVDVVGDLLAWNYPFPLAAIQLHYGESLRSILGHWFAN